jgi:FixJ family two-component response regulator
MEATEDVSQAQVLIGTLSQQELEFLRGIVAGEAQRAIAFRLDLNGAEAGAMKKSLMRKLKAGVTADAVRVGIYAGL